MHYNEAVICLRGFGNRIAQHGNGLQASNIIENFYFVYMVGIISASSLSVMYSASAISPRIAGEPKQRTSRLLIELLILSNE